MPLKASDYPVPIGLRVSREQARKIDTMASQLGLQRNALLRLLVNCARLDSGSVIFGVDAPQGNFWGSSEPDLAANALDRLIDASQDARTQEPGRVV